MALDDAAHRVEISSHDSAQRLGIQLSPSAVEPVTSAKVTVTVLRVSARSGTAPALPHAEQKPAS